MTHNAENDPDGRARHPGAESRYPCWCGHRCGHPWGHDENPLNYRIECADCDFAVNSMPAEDAAMWAEDHSNRQSHFCRIYIVE